MNARRRLQREIVRHRCRRVRPWTTNTITRLTLGNGVHVRVVDSSFTGLANYRAPGAMVYGVWPPTPELLRELGRWA